MRLPCGSAGLVLVPALKAFRPGFVEPVAVPPEKLQKILARAGIASRRACEDLLRSGRVAKNGCVATLGDRADQTADLITLDGRPLQAAPSLVYLLLHKPTGYVTTAADTHGRPTVLDLLPADLPRLFPAGRLDLDSEGLLLLTNDGELTQRLLHPSHHVPRVYRIETARTLQPEALERLLRGVLLEDGPARAHHVRAKRGNWLELELRQGRKRQIRRMLEALGHRVVRLVRVGMGPLKLGKLACGEHRLLGEKEILVLRRSAGLEARNSQPQNS